MDRQLDLVVAESAIRRVMLTYCRGVDRMDLDLIRSVFHPDAVDEHSARYSGPGVGFADYVARSLHAQNLALTCHHVTNCLVELESDFRASAETYFMAAHTNGTDVMWMLGRYLDVLVQVRGEWKIMHRRVVHDINYLTPAAHAFNPSDFLIGRQGRSDPSYTPPRGDPRWS
jgi:SnoaL-like domain